MTYTFFKGWHWALPFFPWLWHNRGTYSWIISFHSLCRYDLKDEDQGDVNKLIGVGWFPSHHKNSARFGWAYDINEDSMALYAYCYIDGKREIAYLCDIDIGYLYRYKISIRIGYSAYHFTVEDLNAEVNLVTTKVNFTKKPKALSFKLSPYFGGNEKAPHTMKVKISKA